MGRRDRLKRKLNQPIVVEAPKTLDYSGFKFEITFRDTKSRARLGRLTTPHGTIETPNYIFCGTKASIKNLSPQHMRDAKTDIILANTYHLMIQPGPEVIERAGGLHKFMQWHGPMMTDSGGFQIFAMGHGGVADEIKGRNRNTNTRSLMGITEEGAKFKSYWNGDTLKLTPEASIDIQRRMGADIIYQFDECTPYHVERDYTATAMERSHRWGDRSLVEFEKGHNGRQALYGIVSGGVYDDLRTVSCDWTKDRPFFGTAIGDCLGGSTEEFYEIVGKCMPQIHPDRPVHLLGIGAIRDVFSCVRMGIDTFDCVSPTRIARHGWALTRGGEGRINIRNAPFRDDQNPLDSTIDISASRDFSRSYIHHLFKAGELLGTQLVAQHNVAMINRLLREVRAAVKNGTLDALEKEWLGG